MKCDAERPMSSGTFSDCFSCLTTTTTAASPTPPSDILRRLGSPHLSALRSRIRSGLATRSLEQSSFTANFFVLLELLSSQMVQAIGAQRAGMDVDNAGAVMGASAPQMRGAVLGRLKAEFCLSVWFGRMIPGLYEVLQYTLSLL